uniref:hypothetical protein n=1 Tax=Sphaerisporangium sp. CA-236357 TaxID=3240030 RepID=UPI003F49366B
MSKPIEAFALVALADQMRMAAGEYAPRGRDALAADLDALGALPATLAVAIRTLTARVEDQYPVPPAVIELLGELHAGLAALDGVARQIGPQLAHGATS